MAEHLIVLSMLTLSLGCSDGALDKAESGEDSGPDVTTEVEADVDGDGHEAAEAGGDDCDDTDPDAHPGAAEDCADDVDYDCDGVPGSESEACEEEALPTSYFLVGERTSDWDCLLYYEVEVELASEDHRCEDCDFTLDVTSTYQRDAYLWRAPECAWEDLASWTMGETFATRWGFTGQSEEDGRWLAWYYVEAYHAFYPTAEATYAMAESGAATLTWNFTYEEDALGSIEAGYWVLDLGGLDL